jgi:hypothetical protein
MSSKPSLSPHEISRQLYFDNGGRTHYIQLDGFGEQYAAGNPTEKIWKEELIALYRQRITEETNATVLASITDNLQYHGATGIKEILIERYVKGEMPVKIATAYACWKGLNAEEGANLLTELYHTADEQSRNAIRSHFNYMWESTSVREFVIQVISDKTSRHFGEIMIVLHTWDALHPSLFDHSDLIGKLSDLNKNEPEYLQTIKSIVEFLKKR